MKPEAIIFDMDGVLVDTAPYIHKAFDIILKKHGIKLSELEKRKTLGLSLRDQIKIWRADHNIKEEINLEDFSSESARIEKELMKKDNLKIKKSLSKILTQAKAEGIKLAVGTSSTHKRAIDMLNLFDLTPFFDVIITSEHVTNHKPHPDIFLKAAEKLGVNPKNCVVFEDAVNGVLAAKAGGMKAIAVLHDFNSVGEFEGKADLIINDFSEVSLKDIEKLF